MRLVPRTPFDERDKRSANVFVRGELAVPSYARSLLPRHLAYVGVCYLAFPWLFFSLV